MKMGFSGEPFKPNVTQFRQKICMGWKDRIGFYSLLLAFRNIQIPFPYKDQRRALVIVHWMVSQTVCCINNAWNVKT